MYPPYPEGDPGYPMPPPRASPQGPVIMDDPKVTLALRKHRQGSFLYIVAWLAIGVAVVLIALDMALILSTLTGPSTSSSGAQFQSTAMDLTLGSLGLLGGGLAVRGVAFSLMMHADFLLRSRIPPRLGRFA